MFSTAGMVSEYSISIVLMTSTSNSLLLTPLCDAITINYNTFKGTITFFVSEIQAGFKMDEVLCLQNFFISATIEVCFAKR